MRQQPYWGEAKRLPRFTAAICTSCKRVLLLLASAPLSHPQVRETQSVVRDGRSGTERVTIARGLGGRERTLVRTRDAAGRELQHEDLRGIDRVGRGGDAAGKGSAGCGGLPLVPRACRGRDACRNGCRVGRCSMGTHGAAVACGLHHGGRMEATVGSWCVCGCGAEGVRYPTAVAAAFDS